MYLRFFLKLNPHVALFILELEALYNSHSKKN
jgi:hypothetical protein